MPFVVRAFLSPKRGEERRFLVHWEFCRRFNVPIADLLRTAFDLLEARMFSSNDQKRREIHGVKPMRFHADLTGDDFMRGLMPLEAVRSCAIGRLRAPLSGCSLKK